MNELSAKEKSVEKGMSRKELIASIEKKFQDGYVLDPAKMKCDRIVYVGGSEDENYDSIDGEWRPCLVTNNSGEVAVDYFEKGEFASLAEQVGITSGSEYTLDSIRTPYLQHILSAMVDPSMGVDGQPEAPELSPLEDAKRRLDRDTILFNARRNKEKPFGYVMDYIKAMYGIPKKGAWEMAREILGHFNIDNDVPV